MGKKFYSETETGGTIFRTERRIGDVRIPNYVYDIWLPLLGAQALGVYAVYCRLERQGTVKAMTQTRIARLCRIGTAKLSSINEQLEDCGFVRIKKPEGKYRLMHWTTEITILNAPQEVSKAMKDKYALSAGYETLTPWLEAESPENPSRFSAEPETAPPETPEEDPNIAALGILQPLEVAKPMPQAAKEPITEPDIPLPDIEGPWKGPAPPAAKVYLERFNFNARKTLWRRIHETVGDQLDDLEFWDAVIAKYDALGWNPKNIDGMLEWYEKRELPHVQRRTGGNGENRHDRNKRIIERARAKYLLPEDTIDAESITIL